MAKKINTWGDRDAGRINHAVRTVESRLGLRAPQRPMRNDSEIYQVAAKRIRGTVTAQIDPEATGDVTGLAGVDGLVYESDPLTVRNQITGFAIPNGSTVLAQYVVEDDEWQVIEIAGTGSPTSADPAAYAVAHRNVAQTFVPDTQWQKVDLGAANFGAVGMTVDFTNNKIISDTHTGFYEIIGRAAAQLNDVSGLSATDAIQPVDFAVSVNGTGNILDEINLTLWYSSGLSGNRPKTLLSMSCGHPLQIDDEIELWTASTGSRDYDLLDIWLEAYRISSIT